MMPTPLKAILEALNALAPLEHAEPWDNVGLLAGDPAQQIDSALLAIDYTAAVAHEIRQRRCQLLIAYHPPLFEPLKRLTAPHAVFDAIRDGIAIYSPHTALDAASNGTNDLLADVLRLENRQPLKPLEDSPASLKLVMFVPEPNVEAVASAVFAAGAGGIGAYSQCSFRSPGIGTFFAGDTADPAVGEKNRLNRVDEIRFECLVPPNRVSDITRALRANHPYEEPAFEFHVLAGLPGQGGFGRIGSMTPMPRSELFSQIKAALEIEHLLIAGPLEGSVQRAAVCAGSCGKLVDAALAGGAELYLTGEMRHHDVLKAVAAGMTVVCTLHSNSERAVLKRLGQTLKDRLPRLEVLLSQQDRDPFSIH